MLSFLLREVGQDRYILGASIHSYIVRDFVNSLCEVFMYKLLTLSALLLTLLGCRDLSVPPPEPNARQELAACSGSTTVAYTSTSNPGKLGDVANIMCRLDQRLDNSSYLATSAATVCAHAINAYALAPPQIVTPARVTDTGQQTCTQVQRPCGYAFFIRQRDQLNTDLELLGVSGCSVAANSARGVLFACCVQPATPTTPGSGQPSTPTTPVPIQ